MTQLLVKADTVMGSEKCLGLYETVEQAPNFEGFHRYQVIIVKRDGNLAEIRRDMGKALDWKGVRYLNIPSYWEHSVEEVIDLAEELREYKQLDIKDLLQLDNFKHA